MIRIEALSKSYGSRRRPVHALRGVTLAVEPGVTAVVGPNGAGKTTLLGLLLGFLHPSAGTVRIDGERPRHYLRRRGVAYLPERFTLPGEWPVGRALRAFARLEGLPRDDAVRRADAALDRLGLGEHRDRPIGTLSRGLSQRVGVAQALLADRDLVVLDEPTEGLDPLWRIRFREIVRELGAGGRTVVLASHELAEVERVADRAVLLDRGEVREVLPLDAPAAGPLRYRLEVVGRDEALRTAFPDAMPDDGDASVHASSAGASPATAADAVDHARRRTGHSVTVTVADAAELSARLAALLAAGGVVRAVVPLDADLEARVRRTLGDA